MDTTQLPDVVFPHLGIEIKNVSRIMLSIGGFNIYWYGLILGLGVLAGISYGLHEAKRLGMDPNIVLDFSLYAIIFCIMGSRIYYVIFSWDDYKDNLLQIFNLRGGGLAIYGTVIAAIITAFVYTRLKKIKFFVLSDMLIPGLILGQIIGRWANFINMEAFGGYTDSILAMQYRKSQVAQSNITQELLDHIILRGSTEYIQVHPTFLYESLWNLGVFILMQLYKKHKKFDGEIVCIYFVGYGIGRFIIEGLRTDQLIFFSTGIPVSQMVSVIFALAWLIFWVYNRLKVKKELVPQE